LVQERERVKGTEMERGWGMEMEMKIPHPALLQRGRQTRVRREV